MTDLTVVKNRKILVTSALPYANGPLHLGHILETIQTDVWVRFQKHRGNQCIYICADDAHGTAIMLKAEQLGLTPEQQIDNIKADHERDFAGFLIGFDNYHSTHSPENKHYAELIYTRLRDNNHIASRDIDQLFDPEKELFLADRFVKGICPKCKAEDQYGDNCEVCGGTYSPSDLIDPRSTISGATPVSKTSTHYFFKLPEFADFLKKWTRAGHLQAPVANKLGEWLESGLQEWDISRDAPYFGFEIPDAPGKFFYVWLDACIGYMSSFQDFCNKQCSKQGNKEGNKQQDISFDDAWQVGSDIELYHFIGKDIINFHALFWPSVLSSANFRTPDGVFAHGFLTINGKKMSKTRGTFINAEAYLKHLDADYLRYYFCSKLNESVDDLDLNFEDFIQKVNTDLVNKLVNIASRCAKFITKGNDGLLSDRVAEPALWNQFTNKSEDIAQHFEAREYSRAIREIMTLADAANQYIAESEPWTLAKQAGQEQTVIDICSLGINLFRVLMIYLKPVVPEMAIKTEVFLNSELSWVSEIEPLLNHKINKFKPMVSRIDAKQTAEIMASNAAL